MAAGSDRRVAAAPVEIILLALLVCFLSAASGLQKPQYDLLGMYTGFKRDQIWYPPPVQVIFIDLGNTNSCVAGYDPGKADTTMFQFCIPSWVAFTGDGATLVGEAAKNYSGAGPDATVFGFKRLLGLSRYNVYDDGIIQRAIERAPYKIGARDKDTPSIPVKNKDGTLVKQLMFSEVASMVIAQLKEKAEEYLGRQVEYAIMTVPQHFSGASRQAAERASRLAGLEIVDMVSEPVAVAVAYGLDRKLHEGDNAFVLHVGGGTADASVVSVMGGSLGAIAQRSDPFLGGDDFDQRVVEHFARLVKMEHGKDISEDWVALTKLRTACERAKRELSSQDQVEVTVESLFDGVDFSQLLSRSKFEELNGNIFRRVVALVRTVMVEAELKTGKEIKIDEIVLVGGSTLVPEIQRLVKDYFNGKEPNIRAKPDETIASGAAAHIYSSHYKFIASEALL